MIESSTMSGDCERVTIPAQRRRRAGPRQMQRHIHSCSSSLPRYPSLSLVVKTALRPLSPAPDTRAIVDCIPAISYPVPTTSAQTLLRQHAWISIRFLQVESLCVHLLLQFSVRVMKGNAGLEGLGGFEEFEVACIVSLLRSCFACESWVGRIL